MAAPKGNKFALGLTTSGRPPVYSDDDEGLKEVTEKCNEYFSEAKENAFLFFLSVQAIKTYNLVSFSF